MVRAECRQVTNEFDHTLMANSNGSIAYSDAHRWKVDCVKKPSVPQMRLYMYYWMPRDMVERLLIRGVQDCAAKFVVVIGSRLTHRRLSVHVLSSWMGQKCWTCQLERKSIITRDCCDAEGTLSHASSCLLLAMSVRRLRPCGAGVSDKCRVQKYRLLSY